MTAVGVLFGLTIVLLIAGAAENHPGLVRAGLVVGCVGFWVTVVHLAVWGLS